MPCGRRYRSNPDSISQPEVSQLASFRAARHRQALVVRRALAGVLIGVVLASVVPSPAPARTIRWTLVHQTCGVVT